MSIREEFEKAYLEHLSGMKNCCEPEPKYAALWAAQWMAKYLAEIADNKPYSKNYITPSKIRQLVKELTAGGNK